MELLQRRGDPETDTVLVAEGEGWHEGVLGIVAARLADRFGRPVIVLALDRDFARGSARSFCGYDIHSALAACGGYLLSFGGHASAAGLRLMRKEVPGFRQAINEHARDSMKERMEAAALEVDVEVTAAEIDLALAEGLRSLEPFGQENPEPVLALRSARLANTPRIVGERHLRLDIERVGGAVWRDWLQYGRRGG
jgi:single-stranded-DNA-specific exonuclease